MALSIYNYVHTDIGTEDGSKTATHIHATSNYGNARIKNISKSRMSSELDRNDIVLVAGFQGLNRYGELFYF